MTTRRAHALAPLVLSLAGLALLGAACPKKTNVQAAALETMANTVVTGVSVPEANQVLIVAGAPFQATAASPDPLQVTVDIVDAIAATEVPRQLSGQGIVKEVQVKELKDLEPPILRVTAILNQEASAELKEKDNGVLLVLTPKTGVTAAAEVSQGPTLPYQETKEEIERLMAGAPPEPVAPLGPEYQTTPAGANLPSILTPMPAPNPDGSASVVGDIYYRTLPDGLQIMIMTNGQVGRFSDYDTGSPAMLYVEFPGLAVATPQKVYPVRWGGISDVTVAAKGGKAVVAIDFAGGLQAYDLRKTTTGVVVTIYKAKYLPGGISSRNYVTVAGDSLRSISARFYGDEDGWQRILSANRGVFTASEVRAIQNSNGSIPLGVNLSLQIPVR